LPGLLRSGWGEAVNSGVFCWRDFGWWRCPDGQWRLLSWNEGSKTLAFCALHRWETDEVLAMFETEDEVARALEGFEAHKHLRAGRVWLNEQLGRR
jgi:hypothetical protein